MIKQITYIIFPSFLFVLTACNKEKIPDLPTENSPYYHVQGLINNDTINWQVGNEGCWLNYGQSDVNGIKTFYGQINTLDNNNAVRVEIVKPEIYNNGSDVGAITSTQLQYLVHKPGSIKFNFGLAYEQFNYVLVKNENGNYEFFNSYPFEEYGCYNLTLRFTDYDELKSFPLVIKYGFEDDELDLGFSSTAENGGVNFAANLQEGEHTWYINDSIVGSEPSLYLDLPDGIYNLKHKYKDIYANEGEYATLIRFRNNEFYWRMKYFYVSPSEPTSNYGKVIVSVKRNGEWYSSNHNATNLENEFNVSNIKTILNTALTAGQTSFDFVFKSVLYNVSQSDSLYLPEMSGRIGVEFK